MARLYCVRDRKAGIFWNPIIERDNVQAIRSFETSCKNSESSFFKWPGDFELLYLGEFHTDTGKISLLDIPQVLADPMQFLSSPMKEPRAV